MFQQLRLFLVLCGLCCATSGCVPSLGGGGGGAASGGSSGGDDSSTEGSEDLIQITGTILYGGGGPLPAVTLTMEGTSYSGVSDNSGQFAVRIPRGSSGVLVASKGGFRFTPSQRSFPTLSDDFGSMDFRGDTDLDVEGKIIYVDVSLSSDCTSGNYSIGGRNGSGNDGDAYRHVQQAEKKATPGTTILIRDGTYRSYAANPYGHPVLWVHHYGLEGAPIRFENFPGEQVIFDGEGAYPTIMIDGRDVFGGLSYIEIVGLEIANSSAYGVSIRQSEHCLIEGNKVYGCKATAILTLEQGEPVGNYRPDSNYRSYGYNTIRGNEVYENASGIRCWGPHDLIEGNLCYNNYFASYPGNSDGISAAAEYLVVRGNVVFGNSDDGIDIGDGEGRGYTSEPGYVLIENNIIFDNGRCYTQSDNEILCGDGAGLKLHTHDPSVLGNGGPFLVRYNIIFGNQAVGFDSAGDYRPQDLAYAPDICYGNIAYNNAQGVGNGWWDAGSDYNWRNEGGGGIYFNNISLKSSDTNHIGFRYRGDLGRPMVSDNNIWGKRYVVGDLNELYSCMDQDSFVADPQFVDPTSSGINMDLSSDQFAQAPGFAVQNSSSAIDAGTNVRFALEQWLTQIQSGPPNVSLPSCSRSGDKEVAKELWVKSINFALSQMPTSFPFQGGAPDIGAKEK